MDAHVICWFYPLENLMLFHRNCGVQPVRFHILENRAAYRLIRASELTDVIVSTKFQQASAFCSTPDLSNESGSWRFGACQCCHYVCGANTLVR